MHVAEFTLNAKPGHFEQVAEIYSEFCQRVPQRPSRAQDVAGPR